MIYEYRAVYINTSNHKILQFQSHQKEIREIRESHLGLGEDRERSDLESRVLQRCAVCGVRCAVCCNGRKWSRGAVEGGCRLQEEKRGEAARREEKRGALQRTD